MGVLSRSLSVPLIDRITRIKSKSSYSAGSIREISQSILVAIHLTPVTFFNWANEYAEHISFY